MKKFTYLGIDETTLGIGKGSSIVVSCESQDERLIQEGDYCKAKDYLVEAAALQEAVRFPSISSFKQQGMNNFHWSRVNQGRTFSRQVIQYASIANIVVFNGYKPESTVIYIDNFDREDRTQDILTEYLAKLDFKINKNNIIPVRGGDKNTPLINFADILAFRIGLFLNDKYSNQRPDGLEKLDFDSLRVDFDENRIKTVDKQGRSVLEQIMGNH